MSMLFASLAFPDFPLTDEQDYEEPVEVDLIASGYEWVCPKCDCENREIEVSESVTCDECESVWQVADYNHAIA